MRIDLEIGNIGAANRAAREAGRGLDYGRSISERLRSGESAAARMAKLAEKVENQNRRDDERAVAKAAREAARNDPARRIMTALRSTRFGAGAASPLVGRTLDVMGMGGP